MKKYSYAQVEAVLNKIIKASNLRIIEELQDNLDDDRVYEEYLKEEEIIEKFGELLEDLISGEDNKSVKDYIKIIGGEEVFEEILEDWFV